jgi:sulfofructose kinase
MDLLALVDHLIVSLPFAEQLTGASGPREAVERLWGPDRALVAVTGGEHGCWYREAGAPTEVTHLPAFPVAVCDTTGCGDVFHGAYASALARGLGVAERMRFASAAAALKATRPGGQSGIPTRAQVEAFLEGLRERPP